jgi:hypothetical protein
LIRIWGDTPDRGDLKTARLNVSTSGTIDRNTAGGRSPPCQKRTTLPISTRIVSVVLKGNSSDPRELGSTGDFAPKSAASP